MTPALFERIVVGTAEFAPADVVHVHAADINPRIVDTLRHWGRRVHANDATTAFDVHRAMACGADRLSTDDLETTLAIANTTHPTPNSNHHTLCNGQASPEVPLPTRRFGGTPDPLLRSPQMEDEGRT